MVSNQPLSHTLLDRALGAVLVPGPVLLAAVRRFHLSHSFYHTKLRSPRGPQVFMVDFLFFEKGGAADENGFGDD